MRVRRFILLLPRKNARNGICCEVSVMRKRRTSLSSSLRIRNDGLMRCVDRIDNLISRFEEPASGARWDSPLITIPFVDGPLDSRNEEGVLCSVDAARIWDAVVKGEIKPPNVATLVVSSFIPSPVEIMRY